MKSTTLPRHGFTMIELMVVIAIIAILASLMLPVLSKAKAKVRHLQCMDNLRNLGRAMHIYAAEYNDAVPDPFNVAAQQFRVTGGNGPWNWMWAIAGVFREYGVEANMFCPANNKAMVHQTEQNEMIGAKGSRELTGRVPYVSGMIHSARIHPTNVVYKMAGLPVESPEGTIMQSPSELVLFADNTPSRGDKGAQFVPLSPLALPAGLRANHLGSDGLPAGGNAFYVDGHSDFKGLQRLRLRTVNNDVNNPGFWY